MMTINIPIYSKTDINISKLLSVPNTVIAIKYKAFKTANSDEQMLSFLLTEYKKVAYMTSSLHFERQFRFHVLLKRALNKVSA